MKIAYITAKVPWGRGETFILAEMQAMQNLGVDLVVIPRNPPKEVFHQTTKVLSNSIWLPLVNFNMARFFLVNLLINLRLWKVIFRVIRHSRTPLILIKNFIIVPKAVYLALIVRNHGVDHIHAHWGSTTATMAFIASELSGIPWSFTMHRWDITENNMLVAKAKKATLLRCISKAGQEELLSIIGKEYSKKVYLIHMGVPVSDIVFKRQSQENKLYTIACPANLVTVKGHEYLIRACKLLVEKGSISFQCLIIGDGPLFYELKQLVGQLDLDKYIHFYGHLPHEKLMYMYEKEEIDVVVLPSIRTEDGEKEGIPVALMEAMSYGIPVIATKTGAILELLDNNSGIVVDEKAPMQIADALEAFIEHPELAYGVGERGRNKVCNEFDINKNSKLLLAQIESSLSQRGQ